MVIAELLASLGVQVDDKSLKKVDSVLGGVAKNATRILGGVAAIFGGASIAGFARELINIAGELDDTRKQLGISATALQQWRYAAEQTGASSAAIANAFKFVSKNAYDAADGLKEQKDAFRALGVSVTESDGSLRNNEALLQDTLTALSAIPDTATRTALGMKVLGRSATELLPLIADGPEALAALRREFDALGGGYSEEFVAQGEKLGDEIVALKQGAVALKSAFGVILFPVLRRVVDIATKLTTGFNRITRGTRFIKAALAVMTAGFVAWGLAAVFAARQAIAAWLAAAAPFLLVAVALTTVALVLDDIAALLTGGKSLIGKYLDEWFGVGTADSLTRSWTEGIKILTETMDELGAAVMNTAGFMIDMATDVYTFWSETIDNIVGDWTSGINVIGDAITGALDAFDNWLDPTGERKKKREERDKNRKFFKSDRWGGMESDTAADAVDFGPGLGGLPGDAVNRVNRDGSAFFDFASNPGVAAPDAVHPALRPGAVEHTSAPVNVTTNAPITVNAPAGASPRGIAREIRKELDARESAQADRVRRALVNQR